MDIHSCVAEYLLPALKQAVVQVVFQKCYGCQVDHPSQIQHDVCIMMDIDEQIHYCLADALPYVHLDHVVKLCKLHLKYFEPHHKALADHITSHWIQDTIFSDLDTLKSHLVSYCLCEESNQNTDLEILIEGFKQ